MVGSQCFDGFQLCHDCIKYKKVGDIPFVQLVAFVEDLELLLGCERNFSESEFSFKTFLIDLFA